jgi:hypothetical protein
MLEISQPSFRVGGFCSKAVTFNKKVTDYAWINLRLYISDFIIMRLLRMHCAKYRIAVLGPTKRLALWGF